MDGAQRYTAMRRAQRLSSHLPSKWDRRLRELGKLTFDYRGFRSTGLRGLTFHRLRKSTRLVSAPYGAGTMIVDTSDDQIGRMVFMRGDWERLYLGAAVDYLRSTGVERPLGSTFVDVGANIGTSTLDALLHFGFERAVCFEPDPRNFTLLRLNLVLNDLDGRTSCHAAAVSAVDGEAVMERAADMNFGDSRLVVGVPEGVDTEVVVTRPLDWLLDDGRLTADDIGLIWVDAQGHDPFVLQGATRLLAAGVPMVVEYCPEVLDRSGSYLLLEQLIADGFSTVIDLKRRCEGAADGGVLAAKDVGVLRSRYRGAEVTDLLLVR